MFGSLNSKGWIMAACVLLCGVFSAIAIVNISPLFKAPTPGDFFTVIAFLIIGMSFGIYALRLKKTFRA